LHIIKLNTNPTVASVPETWSLHLTYRQYRHHHPMTMMTLRHWMMKHSKRLTSTRTSVWHRLAL